MSKLQDAPEAYTFDDFVLVPVHSEIQSRKDPKINTNLRNFQFLIPVISAPMNTISEEEMIVTMCELGGTGVLHRYMPIEEQAGVCRRIIERLGPSVISDAKFYAAVGANGDSEERIAALKETGVHGICVDIANGHHKLCAQTVEKIKSAWPDCNVMSGNVCSYQGAKDLVAAGTDAIRIGIGPGSMCTTRQVTGHGVPQLTAIEDCARIKEEYPEVALIADGGIRFSGDVVKCLAIGADAVMIGGLLAGTIETPGEIIEEAGKLYKYFCGMASIEGRKKWFDKSKAGLPIEGVSTKVAYTGQSAKRVIEGLCQSVKVGLSYAGASNLAELREKAIWRRVTMAGYMEGTPHGKR